MTKEANVERTLYLQDSLMFKRYSVEQCQALVEGLTRLYINGPSNEDCGICYNLSLEISNEFQVSGYKFVREFFKQDMGIDIPEQGDYPLSTRPCRNWGIRKEWCFAMAQALTVGRYAVTHKLYNSLVNPPVYTGPDCTYGRRSGFEEN